MGRLGHSAGVVEGPGYYTYDILPDGGVYSRHVPQYEVEYGVDKRDVIRLILEK